MQDLKRSNYNNTLKVFNHDATQRPIGRKVTYQAQKERYTTRDFFGKSKDHTDKNEIVCNDATQQFYLSPTYQGSIHDKALIDEENIEWLAGIYIRQDTGYQGYAPDNVTIIQPTKKTYEA